MKKKWKLRERYIPEKFIKIMKLSFFIMFALIMQLSANTNAQVSKVSLNIREGSIDEIFSELANQTGKVFFYNNEKIFSNKKIDYKAKEEALNNVLDNLAKLYGFTYREIENYFLISKKEKDDNKKKYIVIKGIVSNNTDNKPLPGVTILIKGTNTGVCTDIDGKYEINIPLSIKNPVLKFSFIGMKSQEIKVKEGKEINATLQEETSEIDEVVVTGYQRIEKRKLSSSVISVKGEALQENGVISVDNMLQGKITGVTVMNQSSTPGAAPKVRIRGSSSITGNREPVWVVDGVILEDPVKLSTAELNSMDKVNLIGNAISFINPEDIDRVDVLKDASATAIYGVKAANGVIVITTKKGKYGKPSISYTNSTTFMDRPNYTIMNQMNSAERIEVSEEMHRRGLYYTEYGPSRVAYEGALMDYWDKNISYADFRKRVKELKETNTDWYDLLFRRVLNQSHNISLSGATDKTNYYVSVGFADQKGVDKDVNYKKYNALMKVSTKLTKNINLGFNLNTAITENERPHESIDLYQYAYETSRAIPAYNSDGTRHFYAAADGFIDPYGQRVSDPIGFNIFDELDHSGNSIKNKMMFLTIDLDWNILPNLKYNCIYNISKTTSNSESWTDAKSFNAQVKRGLPYGAPLPKALDQFRKQSQLPYGGELATRNSNTDSYMFRNSLNYKIHLNNHYFSSNLGFEARSSKVDGYSNLSYGYLPGRGKKFADVNLSDWQTYLKLVRGTVPEITDTETNFISYYGTFTYSFKDKYILNFNVRADGSNKFGKDKNTRFLPVWSISGRYNLSDENFLKNIEWINQIAIRSSFGVQGNVSEDHVPNLILKMGSIDDVAEDFYSELYKVPNNKLKWEKTRSYNLGMDLSFFNNKISGAVELYKKIGEDQIVTKTITTTNGAEHVAINEGTLENKGWEITINAKLIDNKDYKWGLSFNTAKNYNKVTDAGNPVNITYSDYLEGTLIRNGQALNSFYSYQFGGLDHNGYPTFINYEEKDEEGNYLVKNQQEAFDRILVFSGKREPDLSGGFSSYFNYKNLSFSAIFAFNIGNKLRLNNLYKAEGQKLPYPQQNMSKEYTKRWKNPGDEKITDIPTLSQDGLIINEKARKYRIASSKWEMYNNSDLRVVDGSFLRCRSISMTYGFNKEFCKKLRINALNLSLSASNIFVLKDRALEGRDPEQVTFGAGSIPPQRTYSLRLSANF